MTTLDLPRPSFSHRTSRWISRNLIRIYAGLAFIYLFIPVAYTFVFSFNDSGKSNLVWQGFTQIIGEILAALRKSVPL
jgi:spermidine/putrescine transport system permease protein